MGQGEAEGRDGKQVRPGRHALIAPFLTLALLFAAPAEASLSRVSAAERAIEAPSLTLAAAAPELSEFSLFEGTELAAAAAESESAPTFHPLAAVSLLDERVQRDLATPLESSYPKTRYRVFELLGTPILGVERGVSLELQWGCASLSCGFASGTVGWLSQDPMGDKDSPNLYGFVGMRPHEKTDPLGLAGDPLRLDAIGRQDRIQKEREEAQKQPGFWSDWGGGMLDTIRHPVDAVDRFNSRVKQAARDLWKQPQQAPRSPDEIEYGAGRYDEGVKRGYRDLSDITETGTGAALVIAETETGARGVGTAVKGVERLVEAGSAAKREYRALDVVPYRTKVSGLEKHHGVLDVWSKENVPGYVSRSAESPSILLTKEQHAASKAVYRDWLEARTGKRVGGSVDWTKVSPQEARDLSEKMFDAAGVPEEARREYYRGFNQHIYER